MSEGQVSLVTEFKPHGRIEDEVVPEMRYYYSSLKNMKMIRADGKVMLFVHHFYETDQSGEIKYLDEEIDKHKNMHIRRATEQEIEAALWRKDPKAAAIQSVQNDPNQMAELEQKIRERLMGEGWVPPAGDEKRLAGVDPVKVQSETLSNGAGVTKLTPVSTKDIGAAGQPSNGK